MKGTETVMVFRNNDSQRGSLWDDEDGAEETPHHEERGCIVYPRTSEEEGKGEVVIEGENVFMPGPGRDVLASDQVELRGLRYQVEGKPGDYRKGNRKLGILVVLKRLGS